MPAIFGPLKTMRLLEFGKGKPTGKPIAGTRLKASAFQSKAELNRNVVISPDKRVVYLSIPKCACSSVKIFLRTLYGDTLSNAKRSPHDTADSPLLGYSDLDGDNELDYLISNDNVKCFSIIRDPRSRIISAYYNKFVNAPKATRQEFALQLLGRGKGLKSEQDLKNITFASFIEAISRQEPKRMNEHWRPMIYQLLGLGPDKVSLHDLNDTPQALSEIERFIDRSNTVLRPDFRFAPHATNAEEIDIGLAPETIHLFSRIYSDDMYLYLYRKQYSHLTAKVRL